MSETIADFLRARGVVKMETTTDENSVVGNAEKVADILREMREFADTDSQAIGRDVLRRKIQHFADRVEAAYTREAGVAKMETTAGNVAKMRKALELCDKTMSDVVVGARDISPLDAFDEMGGIIDKALAEPPRNCDVGTAEEQTKRLRDNCNKFKPSCSGCKYITDLQKENCWLAWAQMPYEGGGAK